MPSPAVTNHRFALTTSAESTFGSLQGYTVVSDGETVSYSRKKSGRASTEQIAVEQAVFAHIKAMRTLGRTSLNTAEIASALSLPIAIVERAVRGLQGKGVKVPRR